MGAEGRRVRILLVEDNVVNQRVASGLLTRRGHHVTVAAGRPRGAGAARARDLRPGADGPADAGDGRPRGDRRDSPARARHRPHVRIVAMTAHAMNSDRERCLAAGMDGYLSKPIDPRALFAVVEQGDDGSGGAVPAGAAAATFDEEALRHRLSGDDELMTDVIRLFLEDLPVRVAAIQEAVTRRDAEALRAAAHALKGAAGNLSADGAVRSGAGARAYRRGVAHGRRRRGWRQLSVEAGRS